MDLEKKSLCQDCLAIFNFEDALIIEGEEICPNCHGVGCHCIDCLDTAKKLILGYRDHGMLGIKKDAHLENWNVKTGVL